MKVIACGNDPKKQLDLIFHSYRTLNSQIKKLRNEFMSKHVRSVNFLNELKEINSVNSF